ncbi:GNAT family N-acetyltransferase [Pseudalkalibacillus salsuginis]|uniref:GNAT family N-acetyltransferase n=1 Tax=Pseudalkalibacillus salsuginis TaxID=2910972 RepID=UPI001F3371A9|nr:GNAT family protein [Pseudalkalibacillus salsuginis]MCF6411757.1 GNAT family N-acetyltransferase [Pseudalkalibacillus salsuginis]
MLIKGERIHLRPIHIEEVDALLDLNVRNKDFFKRYSMIREEKYYTVEGQIERLRQFEDNRKKDLGYHFGIYLNQAETLIGTIDLFQVLRSSLQSAFIGYFLDQQHNGKGYMTEAAKLVVKYAFGDLHLHRIEAGVMPHNIGSIRVLEKAGFHKEGIAKKNVKINGKWEDHQVLAIINPND